MDLSVEIEDRRTDELRKFRISGKPDWAFAQGDRKNSGSGTVLIAIEAKNPATIGLARNQLLTYLVIMRQLRKQEQKIVDHVQGFYSDGKNYRFMYIGGEGKVYESKNFDTRFEEELKVAFNWILDMMHSAAKSSPNTSPTKPGQAQESELSDFENRVFLHLYEPQKNDDETCDDETYDCDLDADGMITDEW
ncbi:hypothetical protein FN846DRAFT_770923 [Sphaerosporella brunnea]|uniref:Uncharacterized protein n=1 Tax=Sphaerosporella brunnea TaxID=1250544 RepID=A0A5J5FBD8_9PEZI|nr:hypothetical protein FN846DRAFT_770923 [Sphaerosporella brunnea]